jgi:P4 family phage/plasmid primase-like protien
MFEELCQNYSLIRLRGKVPIEKNWERFCTKRRTFSEINFQKNDNAGIACGPASDVLVLDIDDQEKFERVCRDRGWFVPASRAHQTGSGKLHVLFEYPKDGKNYGNKSCQRSPADWGFDIRGKGGQIVAPGSIHPDTGQPYEVIHDDPILPCPDWLLSLYTDKPMDNGRHGKSGLSPRLILKGVSEGQRDETLFKYACRLRTMGVSKDEAKLLVGEVARNCTPPFPERQALEKVDNAWSKYSEGKSETKPDNSNGVGMVPHLNEDFLALQFARLHSDKLKYCHHRGAWYEWTGTYWRIEETRLAFDWCRTLCRKLNTEGKTSIAKAGTAASVEKFAQADRAFAVTSNIWDRDSWLLGTPGGTVDLRTGELKTSRQSDYITKQTLIAPSEDCSAPRWFQFLHEATRGDTQLIHFLWQMSGMCLTGSIREHALFFIYGDGGNGKGTFLNVLISILNNYATTAAMDTFTASKSERHSTDLAMLRGARLVTASETEAGKSWAEAKVKQLTGGDPITARFMRKDNFTYLPEFKLVIIGNYKPVLRNVDDAAKRRFNIIPFVHRPAKKDLQLDEKLREEYPAILRWMIDGCLDWQKQGLVRPESVRETTDSYFDDQDLFGRWIEECTKPGIWESSSKLFESWKIFAERNGENAGNSKRFGERMAQKGYEPKRDRFYEALARGYRGVELIINERSRGCDA